MDILGQRKIFSGAQVSPKKNEVLSKTPSMRISRYRASTIAHLKIRIIRKFMKF